MFVRTSALVLVMLGGVGHLREPSCPWWIQVGSDHPPAPLRAGFGTQRNSSSLRDLADRAGVLIGAAVRPRRLSEPAYAATLSREFNLLQPEFSMQWEFLHPAPNRFDFSDADLIVGFAAEHRMKVRGHALVWHQALPAWVVESKSTPDQLAKMLENHIKTVVGHYRGKVWAWDVVNEGFDEVELGHLRSTIWYDKPGIGLAGKGTAYFEQCFRWAHEADPQALLFYNEAGAQVINAKSNAIYAMVRDFKHRDVPIDGVGFQMHIGNLNPDTALISENIARFTALGVQVHITEMDVGVPVDEKGNARPKDLQRQAEIYRDIATACLSHPGCTAIQMWGFTDKYSWMGSHTKHTKGAALPFDQDYQPKPAYEALREALESRRR